jgi:TPR repeat protein
MNIKTNFKDLLNAYISNDYDPSKAGLFQLGLMYFYGKTYPQDLSKAIKLITEAAKVFPPAYTFLGMAYINGDEVPLNEKKGLKYLEKAVNLNDNEALLQLSTIYLHGNIVTQNINKAILLLNKAVDNNYPDAMLHLGVLYLGTPFLDPDYDKAHLYLERASNLGNPNANAFLGLMYENGDGVVQDKRKALKYYLRATSKNSSIAHYFLAKMYLDDDFIKKNLDDAVSHLEMASEAGHIEAISLLADLYLDKVLPVYNPDKAVHLLQELIYEGEPIGLYRIGILLVEGLHIKQNIKLGLKYLRGAILPDAYIYLGNLYNSGIYTNKNTSLALSFFLKGVELGSIECMCGAAEVMMTEDIEGNFLSLIKLAAKLGSSEALYLYGMCYYYGKGVTRNLNKAIDFFEKASIDNNIRGTRMLGESFMTGSHDDLNKAISILNKAVVLGDNASPSLLGDIFSNKDYGVYDLEKSKEYYEIGVKRGYADAYYGLSNLIIHDDFETALNLIKTGIKNGSVLAKKAFLEMKQNDSKNH